MRDEFEGTTAGFTEAISGDIALHDLRGKRSTSLYSLLLGGACVSFHSRPGIRLRAVLSRRWKTGRRRWRVRSAHCRSR